MTCSHQLRMETGCHLENLLGCHLEILFGAMVYRDGGRESRDSVKSVQRFIFLKVTPLVYFFMNYRIYRKHNRLNLKKTFILLCWSTTSVLGSVGEVETSCWATFSCGLQHIDTSVLTDQQGLTFIISELTMKKSDKWWSIGKDGLRDMDRETGTERVWFDLVLWGINHCWLFNAKSC